MDFMIAGRGEGKTTALLDWLERAPDGELRVCVSAHEGASKHKARLAAKQERRVAPWQFVSIDEVRHRLPVSLAGRPGRLILGLDDAESILTMLICHPIGAVTATGGLLQAKTHSDG